jgi:hypothetical protein
MKVKPYPINRWILETLRGYQEAALCKPINTFMHTTQHMTAKDKPTMTQKDECVHPDRADALQAALEELYNAIEHEERSQNNE